jgi:hypothetical protein
MATLAMANGPMGEKKEKSRPGTKLGSRQGCGRRTVQTVLFFVLVDVDNFSRLIHFDRDLSASGNIPKHTTLGVEFKILLPSRR